MKASKFNHHLKDGNSIIFFNTLTESSFRVSEKTAVSIDKILKNPDLQDNRFSLFISDMKSQGFIIDDDCDEYALLKCKYHNLQKKDTYTFMLLPTYQCNLRCWYCIQKHADSWLSDQSIERIKTRVKKQVARDGIRNITLMWFGGEPLLAFDKVVELTKWTKELADLNNMSFSCSVTTNGTLLNEQRIEQLRQAGVNHYQITIDGDRSTHNSIKVLGKQSAYDTTLHNIGLLSQHTTCSLRFNYTKENMHPESIINDLDRVLPKSRHNIRFTIHKVWQEDDDAVPENIVTDLMEKAYRINLLPVLAEPGLCYTDYKYFDCFFANGTVGKCDNIDPSELTSFIDSEGNVKFGNEEASFTPVMDSDASECKECCYLPICWGPCTAKRHPMLESTGSIRCQFDDKHKDMHDSIRRIHLNREYVKKSQ
ncbi:MAG: radical SAM protein [Muribaculaceae bacterium]|nr:radical SAM protein [Muribaculaceae bacterium]